MDAYGRLPGQPGYAKEMTGQDEWGPLRRWQKEVANEGQEDADLDGVGDACEPVQDEDEDGAADEADNCPFDANPLQEDLNENEIGDVCEEE
jgi:Thrombospondin type 3 repeat